MDESDLLYLIVFQIEDVQPQSNQIINQNLLNQTDASNFSIASDEPLLPSIDQPIEAIHPHTTSLQPTQTLSDLTPLSPTSPCQPPRSHLIPPEIVISSILSNRTSITPPSPPPSLSRVVFFLWFRKKCWYWYWYIYNTSFQNLCLLLLQSKRAFENLRYQMILKSSIQIISPNTFFDCKYTHFFCLSPFQQPQLKFIYQTSDRLHICFFFSLFCFWVGGGGLGDFFLCGLEIDKWFLKEVCMVW